VRRQIDHHLYGQPADMDAVTEVCARHEVPLTADAAESLGATHKERHTGALGRFGWSAAGGRREPAVIQRVVRGKMRR